MLSRFAILASHAGQCDGGLTIDSLRGTRQITTFKNEPMMSPYTPLIAATSAVTTGKGRRGAMPGRVSCVCARRTTTPPQVLSFSAGTAREGPGGFPWARIGVTLLLVP